MTLSLERSATTVRPVVAPRIGPVDRSTAPNLFRPGWALTASLCGLGLWWVLGVSQLIYFVVAIPMLAHLLRTRAAGAPRGIGVWLLFLGWVLVGVTMLYVVAPGTIAGGGGLGRALTFFYRYGWYLVGTIAMLYVVNTRTTLSTSRIAGALSIVFLTLVAGGYLGLLLPRLEFATALEMLLPGPIRQNKFVSDLVHARTAQIQTFLGGEDARPSAPFAFTNVWGLNVALTLPFFVAEWWRRGGGRRVAMFLLLGVAAIPIIFSLNRGLWGAVLMMLVYFAVRLALTGRLAVLLALVVVGLIGAGAVLMSPAGDLINQRLDNPHSNEGRGNLGVLAVESALEGSPVIGFGTTRDVAGNFNSIAGGATADCARCSPPPLGTQGQLWLLIFGSGVGGLMLYLGFFGSAFLRHARSPSPYAAASTCSILVLFVTMPIYNSVGFGIFVALIAVGILGREETAEKQPRLDHIAQRIVRNRNFVAACCCVGVLGGVAVHMSVGSDVAATQSVLVSRADLTGAPTARLLTLDDEALLATSEPVITAVAEVVPSVSLDDVADSLSMSAAANSRILRFTYAHPDADVAEQAVQVATTTYLALRAQLIEQAADGRQGRLDDRLAELDAAYEAASNELAAPSDAIVNDVLATLRVRAEGSLARLSDDEVDDAGRTLAPPSLARTSDDLIVRASSGFALGALAALLLVPFVDRRRTRLGVRPDKKLSPYEIPIIARVTPDAAESLSPIALGRATRATLSYLPVAGVLADPESPTAMALARTLESEISDVEQRRGARIVVVAETDSRVDSVMKLLRSCERIGGEPVGIVAIGETG